MKKATEVMLTGNRRATVYYGWREAGPGEADMNIQVVTHDGAMLMPEDQESILLGVMKAVSLANPDER